MSLMVTFRNISNLAETSDYQYEVFINTNCIEKGFVRGHRRADGWEALMALLASERWVAEQYPRPIAPDRPVKVRS